VCGQFNLSLSRTDINLSSVSLVSSAAKKIIVLADGKVTSDCAPQALTKDIIGILNEDNLIDVGGDSTPAAPNEPLIEVQIDGPKPIARENDNTKAKPTKLVKDEAYNSGGVSKWMIWDYLKFFGGPLILVMLMIFNFADQLGGYVH
jgi:hypothetical protein